MNRLTKPWAIILVLILLLLAMSGTRAPANDRAIFNFAINSELGRVEGEAIHLIGVPSVIYVSSGPDHEAGLMSVEEFIRQLFNVDISGETLPPRGTLAVVDPQGPRVAVEILSFEPMQDGLSFRVRPLDRTLPEGELGPTALFIDAPDQAPEASE